MGRDPLTFMDDVDAMLRMLWLRTPFALACVNDGEYRCVTKANSRPPGPGREISADPELRDALVSVLEHRQSNYWIGIPCPVCKAREHRFFLRYVKDYELVTSAVVTTNRNLVRWKKEFTKTVQTRKVYWIGGEHHKTENLPFSVEHVPVPSKEAFRWWPGPDPHAVFEPGAVVLTSCSFLGTVLPHWLFGGRKDLTVIDVGACYDPEVGVLTQKRMRRIHRKGIPSCKGCN